MSKPYYMRQKWAYSWISYKVTKFINAYGERWEGLGTYYHRSGHFVRISAGNWMSKDSDQLQESTTLEYVTVGYTFTKIVQKAYTERGLMLLCSRFIYEVETGIAGKAVNEQLKKKI